MGRRITTYKAEVARAEAEIVRRSLVLSALGIHQHLKDEDELYCRLTLRSSTVIYAKCPLSFYDRHAQVIRRQ